MKLYKIAALLHSDLIVLKNSKWKVIEYFYSSLVLVIIWGLFSTYMRNFSIEAGLIVLIISIFWNFAYVAQAAINQEMNDDVWSGSFKQIISTGISEFEYLFARMLFSSIITTVVTAVMLLPSLYIFNINIIADNFSLIFLFAGATFIASLGMATMLAAAYITLGREYGFLAWSALQLFVLLSAPFYPISIFPDFMQPLIAIMPYTNIFEGLRMLVTTGYVAGQYIVNSWTIALGYFFVSLPLYWLAFKKARKTGALVKLT